jgi:ectoine hydroxylase-related dioxygenase (phytanoyl-CoA dioxygenase family)
VAVSAAVREALRAEGFAIVRGLVAPAEVAALQAAFDRLVARARTLRETTEIDGARFVVAADPFRLHRVVWAGGVEPAIARWGDDPRVVGLAASVLGTDPVVQLLQQAHFKLPGDAVDFAWHQDASNRRYGSPQWRDVDGLGSFVQIAIAVDPMGQRNGGLAMIPGSHRRGFLADPHTGALPPDSFDPAAAVLPELAAGDALLFGPFVIHGSAANQSDGPRRLFLQGYAAPGANGRVYPGAGLGVARYQTASSARVSPSTT